MDQVLVFLATYWPAGILILIGAALIFLILQLIGTATSVVPPFMKLLRNYKQRKKAKVAFQLDQKQTLAEVKELLQFDKQQLIADQAQHLADIQLLKKVASMVESFNKYYSSDNIGKRNDWMQRVNEAVEIVETKTAQYDSNMELTYRLLKASYRHQILEFHRWLLTHADIPVTLDEFTNIRQIYDDYHKILAQHHDTNGQIDTAWQIIQQDQRRRLATPGLIIYSRT